MTRSETDQDPNEKQVREKDEKLVDSLISISNDRFEVWKYFEGRADRLGEQLWTTGTWLMGLLTATLSLPFVGRFIRFPETTFAVQVNGRIPVVLIAVFGIFFCMYAYVALRDLRHHIEGNWRRALYARTGEWKASSLQDRKRHGWYLLLGVGILALTAFFILLIIACLV